MNIFDRINAVLEDAEGSIITLVTTLIPWLAPLLPAWLTYSHLTGDIGIPAPVAFAMAAAVEFLGLAAIATAFAAMRHNRTHRAEMRKVSLKFPVIAYVFYIVVVLTVNVVLSLPLTASARQYAQVGAIALLTLISAPAFVIAVSRQEQREIDKEWQGRTAKTDSRLPKNDNLSDMTVNDIMRQYGVSERTAYRRKARAKHRGDTDL